jgi:BolA protein
MVTVKQTRRALEIEDALMKKLAAEHVAVNDNSNLHGNHPGAKDGGGHFQVLVVSERFRGLSRVAAQRLVYDALSELMVSDIHALQMRTLTPDKWSAEDSSVGG